MRAWHIDPSKCDRLEILKASRQAQMERWLAEGKCRDLIKRRMRPASRSSGTAAAAAQVAQSGYLTTSATTSMPTCALASVSTARISTTHSFVVPCSIRLLAAAVLLAKHPNTCCNAHTMPKPPMRSSAHQRSMATHVCCWAI